MQYGQLLSACLALAVIFLSQAWADLVIRPPAEGAVFLRGPVVHSSWVLENEGDPIWSPDFQGVDATLWQTYRRENESVDLHVAYYTYQREGAEAVSDLNRISTGSEWKVLNSSQTTVEVSGLRLPVNRLVLRHNARTVLLWYWYSIGGQNTNSRLSGKLLEMKALATGGDRSAAIVAVSSEVSENAGGTAESLRSFLQQSLDSNGALFQAERSTQMTGKPLSPPDAPGQAVKP